MDRVNNCDAKVAFVCFSNFSLTTFSDFFCNAKPRIIFAKLKFSCIADSQSLAVEVFFLPNLYVSFPSDNNGMPTRKEKPNPTSTTCH